MTPPETSYTPNVGNNPQPSNSENASIGSEQTSGNNLKDDAAALAGKAKTKLADEAGKKASAVKSEVDTISSALEKASDNLDGERNMAEKLIKTGLDQAVRGLETFSKEIENGDVSHVMGKLSEFARSNPAVFMGGCAALGFATARVFQASETGPNDASSNETGPGA